MKRIKNYAIILFGVFLTATAVSVFYLPNKIVSGGVSGISTLLYHMFSIPPGISYGIINLILLLLGFKLLGKGFVLKTLACSGLLSLFVQILSYLPPLTDNIFLAALFGSLLYGLGIGLTLIHGASTGGTDILGRLLQCRFPHIQIGRLLLVIDAVVIFASLIVFKTADLTLFGIMALLLSTFAIDWLIRKLNISKLAFVITEHGEEISRLLVSTSPRGVTVINARGAYSLDEKNVLICALKENELPSFQRKILSIDKDAFIIFSESQQIVGNGFRVYR